MTLTAHPPVSKQWTLAQARAAFYCYPVLKVVIGSIPFFLKVVVEGGTNKLLRLKERHFHVMSNPTKDQYPRSQCPITFSYLPSLRCQNNRYYKRGQDFTLAQDEVATIELFCMTCFYQDANSPQLPERRLFEALPL